MLVKSNTPTDDDIAKIKKDGTAYEKGTTRSIWVV